MKEIIFRLEYPDGKLICHEWLDSEGWHNDYFRPLTENGLVSDQDMNVQLIRKQYTGMEDINGEKLFDGMPVTFDLFLVNNGVIKWVDSDSFTGWAIVTGNNDFKIGDTIIFWRWATFYWVHRVIDCKGTREYMPEFFDKYPHLFKKIK